MSEFNTVVARWGSPYIEPETPSEWEKCKQCNYRPKVWEFDHGRNAQCACAKDYNIYQKRSVSSESIMDVITRTGGSAADYDRDALRKEWNDYVLRSESNAEK